MTSQAGGMPQLDWGECYTLGKMGKPTNKFKNVTITLHY